MKARVKIQQFENESNQGRLLDLGIAELPLQTQYLGARLTSRGCSSNWVTQEDQTVQYVVIGGRDYVVRPVTFPGKNPHVDFEVNLPYQHKLIWTTRKVEYTLIEEPKNIAIGASAKVKDD